MYNSSALGGDPALSVYPYEFDDPHLFTFEDSYQSLSDISIFSEYSESTTPAFSDPPSPRYINEAEVLINQVGLTAFDNGQVNHLKRSHSSQKINKTLPRKRLRLSQDVEVKRLAAEVNNLNNQLTGFQEQSRKVLSDKDETIERLSSEVKYLYTMLEAKEKILPAERMTYLSQINDVLKTQIEIRAHNEKIKKVIESAASSRPEFNLIYNMYIDQKNENNALQQQQIELVNINGYLKNELDLRNLKIENITNHVQKIENQAAENGKTIEQTKTILTHLLAGMSTPNSLHVEIKHG
jgi:hypothetical protein